MSENKRCIEIYGQFVRSGFTGTAGQTHYCPIFGVNNGNSYPGVKKIGKCDFSRKCVFLPQGVIFMFFDFWSNGVFFFYPS